ncbi:hypothetical protein [Hyphomicrobium sp. 802]|uniref:hypothetical protein n=1 Tax=Hyphomicrobium sp. 802 TaxID=1112272 RepID=UPI00045E8E36|nr:hypothetical protein [Hyphomicrobium sp. 802]
MPLRVLILDTSVLCCLLEIPGKEICGPDGDKWDKERVTKLLKEEKGKGSSFVIPLATIIETGNHIAQSPKGRFELATAFGGYMKKAADGSSPWAAFIEQADLWTAEKLNSLADNWPTLAAAKTSLGDATIMDVAEFYAKGGFDVEIVTGDLGLKSYEPRKKPMIPRRRN